jgi:phosphate ABC transporter phosphate-binding protein
VQPLWSYLITPGTGSLSGAITTDLGSRGAKLLMTAVGQGKTTTHTGPASSAEGATPSTTKQTLKGGGATFPAPLYQEWFQTFRQIHPEIDIVYDPVGSEEGMRRLLVGKTDFAASDVPASPEGVTLQRFATVLGAVVPIYNLKNVGRELRFTPEILAGIYLGKISRWDDPAIHAVNRGLSLPNAPIAVFHRSDGSGTTYAFTDFLSHTDPAWKSAVGSGSTVSWPAGIGAEGNSGVASQVERTPNSIGYVELTYAVQHELSFGSVRNAAGNFVSANLETVAAAAHSATGARDPAGVIGNPPGSNSYPIYSFTWIVLPMPVATDHRSAFEQLLRWMLTSGQKQCSALGYAPLPRELASRELEALVQLK